MTILKVKAFNGHMTCSSPRYQLKPRPNHPVSGRKQSRALNLGPCTLEGCHVSLEPLRQEHAQAPFEAARFTDWQWTLSALRSMEEVDRRVAEGLESEAKGDAYAFAVKLKETGRVFGSTS